MFSFLRQRLSPFRHIAYRRFFFVQMLSQVGTWSHELARAWLTLEISAKASALGSITMAAALPILFLIMHAGVLVDRRNPRKLMIITRFAFAISALAFAALVEFHQISLWHIVFFACIEGLIASFDMPSYQALAVRFVPKEEFQRALALNSSNFHSGRAIGPLVAGALLAWHGPSAVFLFDGITYLLLVVALISLGPHLQPRMNEVLGKNRTTWFELIDGVQHLFKKLTAQTWQFVAVIVIIYPVLAVVTRAYLKVKFNLDEDSFGKMFAAPAMGSFLGGIIWILLQPKEPMKALFIAVPGLALSLILLPHISTIEMSMVALFFTGLFSYQNFTATTHSMHIRIDDNFRGRLGSFLGLGFLSIGPLLAFPVGFLSDIFGHELTLYLASGIYFLLSTLLFFINRRFMFNS